MPRRRLIVSPAPCAVLAARRGRRRRAARPAGRASSPHAAGDRARPRAPRSTSSASPSGLNRPTWVGVAPGDPEALWVLEQPGRVVRLRGGRRATVARPHGAGHDRRRAGPARHRVPSRLRDQPPAYLHWTDRERRHARRRVPRRPRRSASCCSSTSRRPTTTAASSRSAPTGASTSAWATAAARSTPSAAPRTRATGSASCCPSTSTARAALARRADRPAQPVALRVRPRARRGLDRRRRPGPDRGDQPRPARARRAAEEPRLERVRGHRARRPRATTR